MNMKSITGRTCSWTSCSRPTSSRRRCTVSLVWTVITIMYTVTSTILTYVLSIFTMVIAPIVSYKYIKELETTAQFEHHIRRGRPSPHLGSIFVQKRRRRRMTRPEGPSRCFGYGSFVEQRGSSGEARRAEPTSPFRGVWSKTPNSSPRRLAIGCFQGNQDVILLSIVLCRAIAFQQTVLPPSRAFSGRNGEV